MKRRKFLVMGLTGIGLFVAGCSLRNQNLLNQGKTEPGVFHSLDSIGELLPADENGVMLPAGFKSRIVARSGELPFADSNYIWHPAPDGGATFVTDDGGWIYVSNSEIRNRKGGVGALRGVHCVGRPVAARPVQASACLLQRRAGRESPRSAAGRRRTRRALHGSPLSAWHVSP